MSKLTEEQLAKARKRFLDAKENADAARQVASLTETQADALGIPLDEYRRIETDRFIRAKAASMGEDSADVFFSLASDTAEEFAALKSARDEAIQRALGNSW